MSFTPEFQSISQRNNYTGQILKIEVPVEFPTRECAEAVAAKLGGQLIAVPANGPDSLYVTWFDDLTGREDVDRYCLQFRPEDPISPKSWEFAAPKPSIPSMSYIEYKDVDPPGIPTLPSRVRFTVNAGVLAYCWARSGESAEPANSYWSAGKTVATFSGPERMARNLILLAERAAYRDALDDQSAPSLFDAG